MKTKTLPSKRVSPKAEAEKLIRRARNHPLGISFLRHGSLDSVAAIFKVHSFTVERARETLAAASRQTHRI